MLGALGRVGGRLLKSKLARDVAKDAAVSGGLNSTLMLLSGASPQEALVYGGMDALASAGSIGAVRKLRPKGTRRVEVMKGGRPTGQYTTEQVRSRLEMPLNVGASLLSTVPAAKLLGHDQMLAADQGVNGAQTRQIEQQTIQRSLINNDPYQLAGAYMPDTLLQNTGLPNSNALLQQAMNDGNPYAGMLQATDADMARIVGLG